MNIDKWKDIKAKVLEKFEVVHQEELIDEDEHGTKEILDFQGPLGLIRLEFSIRDLIIDKHTNYSNRIGSDVQVEYVYSDDEKTYKLKIYQKKGENEWEEMELERTPFVF